MMKITHLIKMILVSTQEILIVAREKMEQLDKRFTAVIVSELSTGDMT